MGWGEPDTRDDALNAETARADAAEARCVELQQRLEARARDQGTFTQSTVGKIKALEECTGHLARMQDAQATAYQRLAEVGRTSPEGRKVLACLCADVIDLLTASPRCYITRAGTVLTDHDLDTLVAEAERGYCTHLALRPGAVTCGKPLPCPDHQEAQ